MRRAQRAARRRRSARPGGARRGEARSRSERGGPQAPTRPMTSPARRLGPADAAVFETHVVPRYLAMFAGRLLEMLVPSRDARVCHLQCRTGFPDRLLLDRLQNAHVFGVDASEPAIELARAKAKTMKNSLFDYRVAPGFPLPFPD